MLDEHLVCLDLGGNTKEDVIIGLTELLQGDPRINNFELMRQAVLDRENMMSTGVGKGIALPHAKTAAVNNITLAFATTTQPIDFNAVDNVPVRILFLILSAESEKTAHIKLLSRISRMMNDDSMIEQLLNAENAGEIISIFKVKEQA